MSEPEFRIVETAKGMQWMVEAWGFMGEHGKSLFRATLLLFLLWSLVRIPVLGMIIGVFDPVFRAGLLLGVGSALMRQAGPQATKINLLDAWKRPELRQPLMLLGLALIAVSFLFAAWVAADLQLLQEGIAAGTLPVEAFQQVLFAIAVNVSLIGVTLWLGLPEITFRGGSLVTAISRGLRATLANWRALSMLGLWLALGAMVALLVITMVTIMLLNVLSAVPLVGMIVLIPGVFVVIYLIAFIFVLQFICWRDILSPAGTKMDAGVSKNNSETETETSVVA